MRNLKPFWFIIPLVTLVAAGIFFFVNSSSETGEEIVVSIPYNRYVRSIDTNYYKQWLEAQTGLSIKFNIIYENNTAEYLHSMFASGYVQSDAFFSFISGEELIDYNAIVQEFGDAGYIIPLNTYIERSKNLNFIFEEYPEYDLRSLMTSPDGNMYYMPGFDPSMPESHYQVLWLNQNWLNRLNIKMPRSTEEFRYMLYAFKTADPNGNGIQDEIPLAGSRDTPGEQVYDFIINAFVYNDPFNSRFYVEDSIIHFAPITEGWREAMQYLNDLYREGLISPFQFTAGHNELAAIANDPQSVLGGFASKSITDVVFNSNSQIINGFTHLAPIATPDGIRRATAVTPMPRPAGVITSSCKNPEAVFMLLDLMMSEEAFLIGRYGEQNVDWMPAHISDIDFYGRTAAIKVINHLRNRVQNKHLNEMVPFFAYPKYADSVTFTAFEASQEYRDARAYRAYEQFKPHDYIRTIHFSGADSNDLYDLRRAVDLLTEEHIEAFITGTKNPFDDNVWEAYIREYEKISIDVLLSAVQMDYNKQN